MTGADYLFHWDPIEMRPEQAPDELQSSAKKRVYAKPTLSTLQMPELWKDEMPEIVARQEKPQAR
jgi:hypothetical protein